MYTTTAIRPVFNTVNNMSDSTLILIALLFIAAVVTAITYNRMNSEEFRAAFYDKLVAYMMWATALVLLLSMLLAFTYFKTGYRPSWNTFLLLVLLCLAAPVVSVVSLGLSLSTAAVSLVASYVAVSFLQIIGTISVLLLTNWMVTQLALSQRVTTRALA